MTAAESAVGQVWQELCKNDLQSFFEIHVPFPGLVSLRNKIRPFEDIDNVHPNFVVGAALQVMFSSPGVGWVKDLLWPRLDGGLDLRADQLVWGWMAALARPRSRPAMLLPNNPFGCHAVVVCEDEPYWVWTPSGRVQKPHRFSCMNTGFTDYQEMAATDFYIGSTAHVFTRLGLPEFPGRFRIPAGTSFVYASEGALLVNRVHPA